MAVLLTLGRVSLLTGTMEPGWALGQFFLQQTVVRKLEAGVIREVGVEIFLEMEEDVGGPTN